MRVFIINLVVTSFFLSGMMSQAHAKITLLEKDQWKVMMGGFIETDAIVDSTRSLTEVSGNTPIVRPDKTNGQAGRTQFSIRNTRLAFTVMPPEFDGWSSKGYFEMDFLGYDPAPPTTTEAAYFNNPTFRARHAYLSAQKEDWQFMAGQYWMLLGWQPYYFMPSVQVAPLPAMLYGRTAQVRGIKSFAVDNKDTTVQAALGVMRPPQRDSMLPGLEAGLRFAWDGRKAGFMAGPTGEQETQPMSLAVTGAFRQITTPQTPVAPTGDQVHHAGGALAVDALIPVLASSDGKDTSHTLMLGGEFTTGSAYGDQFVNWTGNLSSPLNSAAAGTPESGTNLDGGIGGFDANGNFQPVHLTTFNVHLQYYFPEESRTWMSAGFGRLLSDNIYLMGTVAGKTTAGLVPYNKESVYFGNIFHNLSKQIRLGLEYAYTKTNYTDGITAGNNRYQLSAWFIF